MLAFYAVLVTFDHYKLEYKYQATPDRLMFLESALTLRYYSCMCLVFLCSLSFENLQCFQVIVFISSSSSSSWIIL